MTKTTDKEKQEALAEWRKENWKSVFEKNKQILETIIDDPKSINRDRIEAAKTLARMVDGLSAEKIMTSKEIAAKKEKALPELSEKERAEYERILGITTTPQTS